MLAYTPKDKIDLIAPMAQILGASLHASRTVAVLSGAAILALLFAYFTQAVACVAQVSRLPMVAGWDGAAARLVQPVASALQDAGAQPGDWWWRPAWSSAR